MVVKDSNRGTNYSLDNFKKNIKNMVATSEDSYNSDYAFTKGTRINPYTKEEILQIIETNNSSSLREASRNFFYSSGFYRRFMVYYATLLKYDTLLIPHFKSGTSKKSSFDKKYESSVKFIDMFNPKETFTHITLKVFVEGAYYGFIRDFGENGVVLQDLPFDRCRSRFKNGNGIGIVEFDVRYFDSITDKTMRDEALKSFPSEIRKAYNSYKNKATTYWYSMEDGVGVYFNLFEEKPFMLNVIPAILDFEEYREIEKERDTQDLEKILVQKLPLDKNSELVFQPDEAEEIHKGVVGMLRKNKSVSVLTTFGADVNLEDLQSSRQSVLNNLEKIEKTIYSEAGTSKQIFAADSNLSLEKSLQNDLALMMVLANQYATFLEYAVNKYRGDSKIYFKVRILPVSYYNDKEMFDNALKGAQYGYSFLMPSILMGTSQSDLLDIKILENDMLKLNEYLIPLSSSFTESAGGSDEGNTPASQKKASGDNLENPGGAPKKDESQVSDKTIENQETAGG